MRLIDAVKQNLPAFLTASRAHQNERSLALLSDDEGIGGAITQLKNSYRDQFEFNSKMGEALRLQNQHIYRLTKWGMALTNPHKNETDIARCDLLILPQIQWDHRYACP
ncbi:hypothetical protein DSJ_04200 [Pantoea stewartii subsp. stewartii DC283]|uniref:Uncharacterized protein n=1 Tax=Pantoea stewartii subsp. stewartii DC283 TaxID=660596 RepID=H3RJU1_PANSE|nr:hypothetical protein DSJ_04200 [Pantoea stewartii subsp. stewartii DC283]EHT98548.1 hypothetical protein CKS_4935 [Pantoea stewartii subsp. stewartii DC283]